jgi:hypothetical protein
MRSRRGPKTALVSSIAARCHNVSSDIEKGMAGQLGRGGAFRLDSAMLALAA